jgi:hypothetical protein
VSSLIKRKLGIRINKKALEKYSYGQIVKHLLFLDDITQKNIFNKSDKRKLEKLLHKKTAG